jgi:alkylresorcinol/alkylpyrone synthase
MGHVFPMEPARLEAMMAVVDNTQVRRRYFIHPVEYIVEPRPLSEISLDYQQHAISLGRRVSLDCLRRAGMRPRDIDLLITVSCTGVMIPSLDAHLINELGFKSSTRRIPITELGCAGGAAALARSADYIRAYPEASVLVVAVELPSLTFQRKDFSPANLISSVLFGDGASAAVLTGRPCNGPHVLDSSSYLFPDSIGAMGFDLKEDGFHIVLSKDVPQLVQSRIRELMQCFLNGHGLSIAQIAAWLLHPGGQKLLTYIEEELGLAKSSTEPSWSTMRDFGNLSSASVLFVLHEWLENRRVNSGEYGLLAAFGPGFSAEMSLLQWK